MHRPGLSIKTIRNILFPRIRIRRESRNSYNHTTVERTTESILRYPSRQHTECGMMNRLARKHLQCR